MLVDLKTVLKHAENNNSAIGAFNTPTLEMVRAVITAAENENTPVIIQHSEGHSEFISLEEIGPIMISYAKKASVPVCVHLDHGASFEDCARAIKLGFTSVMIDASTKPFEENLKITQEVVKMAHAFNVNVEAELGQMMNSSIGAKETKATQTSLLYTDPKEAKDFVAQTQVDCLAVAIGTVHGIYLKEPKLNIKRINELKEATGIPLVMHGGSGLSKQDYKNAINNGIRKINYYTYMNGVGAASLEKQLKQRGDYIFFDELIQTATQVMIDHIRSIICLFNNKER